MGNGEKGQFTVGDDGAAEGGRGLLAASLGDTATTTENAQQPTQTQPRKKLGSVIFAPLQKKIHIQILTDAICIVIVVAWLAVFACFGLLFFILFMLLVFVFVFAHLCLCLCLVFAVCVYCARAVCFLLRCRVYVGTPYASACAMYMHMPREIEIEIRDSRFEIRDSRFE